MKIYILRHGQTDWNLVKRLQGQTNIPLNEAGRNMARLTGVGVRDLHFDGVYTSPLDRAVETVSLVLELPYHQECTGKDLSDVYGMPFYTDDRLLEMSYGIYEGLSGLNPDYDVHDPEFHYYTDNPPLYKPPKGAESFADMLGRTKAFLDDMAKLAGRQKEAGIEKTYIVSTHGATTRALLMNIEHTPLKDFWADDVPKNCSFSVAVSDGGEWKLMEKDVIYYEDI